MSWKKKLIAGSSLATLSTVTIHLINKIIFLSATVDNLLSNPSGTYYEWNFGKVYYTKQGNGSPLLLVHDLSAYSSGYEWNKISKKLAETYAVYTIDLPGCGRSDKPNITYTNYLFVQFLLDFIKHVIGEKTKVIVTGKSCSFVTGACQTETDVIDEMIFINPTAMKELNRIPNKRSKMLAWMINTPVFGTFFYNIFVKEKNIETLFKEKYFYLPENVTSEMIKTYYECCHSGGAVCKYLFSSQVGHYTTVNIKHCLSSINNNIFIISGEDPSDQETAEEYKTVLPSIEITSIKETKYLPHLEAPGKFLEQVAILFSQEEEPL